MICKIAETGVDIPDIGDLRKRCLPYKAEVPVDIILDPDMINPYQYPSLSSETNIYIESGKLFAYRMLPFEAFLLHASAVIVSGKAFLFSGPPGMGKSTHTQKYIHSFSDAKIINDDKPILKLKDGVWYAYGTPWCGKNGINENTCAPVAAICFLHRGDRKIERLLPADIIPQILKQASGRHSAESAALLLQHIDKLIKSVPFFDFANHAQEGDEYITFETMNR